MRVPTPLDTMDKAGDGEDVGNGSHQQVSHELVPTSVEHILIVSG